MCIYMSVRIYICNFFFLVGLLTRSLHMGYHYNGKSWKNWTHPRQCFLNNPVILFNLVPIQTCLFIILLWFKCLCQKSINPIYFYSKIFISTFATIYQISLSSQSAFEILVQIFSLSKALMQHSRQNNKTRTWIVYSVSDSTLVAWFSFLPSIG